jgi:hypothetical protein
MMARSRPDRPAISPLTASSCVPLFIHHGRGQLADLYAHFVERVQKQSEAALLCCWISPQSLALLDFLDLLAYALLHTLDMLARLVRGRHVLGPVKLRHGRELKPIGPSAPGRESVASSDRTLSGTIGPLSPSDGEEAVSREAVAPGRPGETAAVCGDRCSTAS